MNQKRKKDTWLKGRLSNILLGLFITGSSLYLYTRDEDYIRIWGHPIPKSIEILFFIFGVMILVFGLVRREIEPDHYPYSLICTKCHKILMQSEASTNRCPKCDGDVQSVKEFCDKNPDFTNRIKKNEGI